MKAWTMVLAPTSVSDLHSLYVIQMLPACVCVGCIICHWASAPAVWRQSGCRRTRRSRCSSSRPILTRKRERKCWRAFCFHSWLVRLKAWVWCVDFIYVVESRWTVLSDEKSPAGLVSVPLPFTRQHLGYGDCLEHKREDYQHCSVLYCVTQLCTIIYTLIRAVLTGELF